MKNFIRAIVIGGIVSFVVGRRLAERRRAQAEQAEPEAPADDAELEAIRQKIGRESNRDQWVLEAEDSGE